MTISRFQRAPLRAAALAILMLLTSAGAHAQLFKCRDAQGRLTVQDVPCAADPRAPARAVPTLGSRDPRAGAAPTGTERAGANWDMQRAVPAPIPAEQRMASPARQREPEPAAPAPTQAQKEREFQQRRVERANQEIDAYNERVKAQNKANACTRARQQLRIVRDGRGVHQLDNKGERIYLEDANRPAEQAGAEQRVNAACQ